MNNFVPLSILGSALIVLGVIQGGWFSAVAWLGFDFLVLGIAHGRGLHGIFGKRGDGTVPIWSRIVFLPLFIYTAAVWHLIRLFSREPARNDVSEQLVVGRRLLASELAEKFDNYVDLTAEFAEPSPIRRRPSYLCFPVLDAGAPSPEALRTVVERLQPGRTFIHCAQGHGRTGLFALAVLLRSGVVRTVDEGLRMLMAARPGIRLNKAQAECIEAFALSLK